MKYERLTDRIVAEMLINTEGGSWDSDNIEAQCYIRLAELEDKIESGEIDYVADRGKQIARLTAENAELKSSLTHANEECLKWHERAQNLLKDSGGSISGYEKKISDLQAKNAELRHRAEVAEKALDKACENIGQLMDCLRWAANGGVITIEEYTPEKATPQAYIDRAEKELTEGKKDANQI